MQSITNLQSFELHHDYEIDMNWSKVDKVWVAVEKCSRQV